MGATKSSRDCGLGLVFQRLKTGKHRLLQGYVDIDYARNLAQQRSITGYVFTVAECAISLKAELQDTIALSAIEAEYIAAVEVSKEALWLRGLVETSVSYNIHFGFIATAKVLFISLKITGITSGRSTLM